MPLNYKFLFFFLLLKTLKDRGQFQSENIISLSFVSENPAPGLLNSPHLAPTGPDPLR